MKKLLIITVIAVTVFATGCGKKNNDSTTGGIIKANKTMTCTKETTDDDGSKMSEMYKIVYNSTSVLNVQSQTTIEYKEALTAIEYALLSAYTDVLSDIDGLSINTVKENNKKMQITVDADFQKLDVDKVKEAIDEDNLSEDCFYSQKDITIDEFKSKYLNGYTCK